MESASRINLCARQTASSAPYDKTQEKIDRSRLHIRVYEEQIKSQRNDMTAEEEKIFADFATHIRIFNHADKHGDAQKISDWFLEKARHFYSKCGEVGVYHRIMAFHLDRDQVWRRVNCARFVHRK